MGKRSRRERRALQGQNALSRSDPGALRAFAERQPEAAARLLSERLRGAGTPGGGDDALVAVAESLAGTLRRSGQLAAARELAASTAHRSRRLRLEQGLSAFAMGDDAETQRIAEAEPSLSQVLLPLVNAARGVVPAPLPARSDRDPAVGALHDVASAAALAARGEVKRAVQRARGVPGPLRSALLASEMELAASLAAKPLTKDAKAQLAGFPSCAAWSFEPVRKAFVAELSGKAPALASNVAAKHGLRAEMHRLELARRVAGGRGESIEEATLDLVRRFGADAFDAASRPAALLYEAFAWIAQDRKRAARALDGAVEQGADLVETARARLLLAMRAGGAICSECGVAHGQATSEAASAADRLSRALRRVAGGGPLAVSASALAAEGWLEEGDPRAASASIADARAILGAGRADTRLDVLEAAALSVRDPQRARALAKDAVDREPRNADAWGLRIELELRLGDPRAAERLVEEGAAATGDADLRDEARRLRAARGEVVPFEAMTPGAATAGALAAALRAAWRRARHAFAPAGSTPGAPPAEGSGDFALPAKAKACRDALVAPDRVAFDAAWLALAVLPPVSGAGSHEGAGPVPDWRARRANAAGLLKQLVEAWWASPDELRKIAAVALCLDMGEQVERVARELSPREGREGAGRALRALVDAAIACNEDGLASRVFSLGAASWTRAELIGAQAAVQRSKHGELALAVVGLDAETIVSALDTALEPELRLSDILNELWGEQALEGTRREGAPAKEPWILRGPRLDDPLETVLRGLLEAAGVPPEIADRLPSDRFAAYAKKLEALANQPGVPTGPVTRHDPAFAALMADFMSEVERLPGVRVRGLRDTIASLRGAAKERTRSIR